MGTNITGIGNANAIGFKSRVTGGAYFPPELKDALVGVWSAYGKSNDSTDRNIIKNKIKDKGGDFELLNFNYKEGSGYGKYNEDYTSWIPFNRDVVVSDSKLQITNVNQVSSIGVIATKQSAINSCKVKITGIPVGIDSHLYYRYDKRYGGSVSTEYYRIYSDGIYDLPASIYSGLDLGFTISGLNDIEKWVGLTIEQIPEFKGAVVTDGIDDLIVSQKSVQEMLGGSNECTVISMIHQITDSVDGTNRNNWLFAPTSYLESRVERERTGKTGIYGYTSSNISSGQISNINTILGDKEDYTTYSKIEDVPFKYFSVEGFETQGIWYLSQVAWYWTFIANRVLTKDEINLVIEKYNLDRPGEIVKPQVYYNVKKQKITNDNHSAFDDKLIDYSGNGYDAKLYNLAWEGNSGIGNYPVVFGTNKTWQSVSWQYVYNITNNTIHVTNVGQAGNGLLYSYVKLNEELTNVKEIPSFIITIKGLEGNSKFGYRYLATENANTETILYLGNGTHELPKSFAPTEAILAQTRNVWIGLLISPISEGVLNFDCNITIEVIPSNANSLCFDGIDDYGQFAGDLGLKDYTFLMDRAYQGFVPTQVSAISRIAADTTTPFIFEHGSAVNSISAASYGRFTKIEKDIGIERKISYQSTYTYNGNNIDRGTDTSTGDGLTLGRYANAGQYAKLYLWMLMLFPYSMSEFLIERQIEKIKGGTLYPNQVEFRPIIPEDENITKVNCFVVDSGVWKVIKPGDYVDVGARIALNVYTKLPYKIAGASSTAFTGMTVGPSTALDVWDVKGYIKDKTPQKIKLTLAVNEDIVQWNPTISANIPDSYDAVTEWFINGWETKIAVGDWIKKSDRIFFKLKLKEPLHEIGKVTFGGSECQATKASNWSESNNLWEIVTYSSVGDLQQVFNVQVDEYIRFEDNIQPYPLFVKFRDENGKEVSWGGKIRVGSTVEIIKENLLPELYEVGVLNEFGKPVTGNTIEVKGQLVFTADATWVKDSNEPECILSPSRLRIPNSSYKILGYIPDISGHVNDGMMNNFAYKLLSGANGYNYDYADKGMFFCGADTTATESYEVKFYQTLGQVTFLKKEASYDGKIKIKGVSNAVARGEIRYFMIYTNVPDSSTDEHIIINSDGEYDIKITGINSAATHVYFFAVPISGSKALTEPIIMEQIGNYDGSILFDGVDDFVTIPTLSSGGKQVLMKVNWQKSPTLLYDQRASGSFAVLTTLEDDAVNPRIAYQARNSNGKTYIDGIENNNIETYTLKDITHNITIANSSLGGGIVPVIGCNTGKTNSFAKMALYDFMLFDEISMDDEIKELNEYVGIEGNIFEFNPPTFTIDLPMAIKNIKVYQGGSEISSGYLYLNKDTEFEVYISLNDGKYAIDTITVDGVEITKDRVVGEYNIFKFTLNGSSEQKITIHSYEYIMYEDIIQPYPTIFELKDTSINKIYTYGDKLKVGSEFLFNRYINLLPEMYKPVGAGLYNGNEFKSGNTYIVSSTMVFSWTLPVSYLLEGSAPKCIFSPSKLRIPNSSYKYLGYIPDISGNGNNGTFTNFAFSGMSGADGYLFDFNTVISLVRKVSVTDDTIVVSRDSTSDQTWVLNLLKQSRQFDLYVNWEDNSTRLLVWAKGGTIVSQYALSKEWNSIPAVSEDYDYIYLSYVSPSVLGQTVIKQKAKYEGSICFDGIDDFIKIDTTGGMTMLMKANVMSTTDRILYDQRDKNSEGNLYKEFAILTGNSDSILAYAGRNKNGKTYIDGVLNTNITCGQLLNITHNITALPESNLVGTEQGVRIGASAAPASYCKAAVFDFMLFDTKCTDDVIKQLNDIIGIEGNYVQKPSYYWDAYGKNNLDGDRETIPQLGIAEDYSFASFDNELDWYLSSSNYIDVVSRNEYEITLKNLSTGINGWCFQNNTVKGFITKDIPFKIKSNKTVRVYWDMHYNEVSSTELRQKVVSVTTINPNEDTLINLRHLTEEELTELNVNKSTMYYLLWFDVSTLAVNEEVTIEMLPVEGGRNLWLNNYGFAYDKMSGYGGYNFAPFTNTSEWKMNQSLTPTLEVVNRNATDITIKRISDQVAFWSFANPSIKTLSEDLVFNVKTDKAINIIWQYKYRTAESPNADINNTLLNVEITPNVENKFTLVHKTPEEIAALGVIEGTDFYMLYFSMNKLAVNEEVTIKMLPLYPNGLVYDGVDDYSENINIPTLSDFTLIVKALPINESEKDGGAIIRKGASNKVTGGGYAFIYALDSSISGEDKSSYWSFGKSLLTSSPPLIGYMTKTNVNGVTTTSGANPDERGICVAKWTNYKSMVFYKSMLYPRTTDMLTINMIKNMMAEDGIIDIQGKLFTDKFTGDFNLDFNKDFLIGN